MIFQEHATIHEKLNILADAAKYDVACTSSGVSRGGKAGSLGNAEAAGICHTFSGDGRCISLLKILYTNECIYNCKYCVNRVTNDVPRASFTPEEVCELTMEFYRRNYIEGLFLSSGILQTPDYTMEQICKALHDLRVKYKFNGYIHCKAVPGASGELIELAGWYADRMSINMELPTADGLKEMAPNKTRKSILTPMRQIQAGVEESQYVLGMKGGNKSAYWYTRKRTGKELPGIGTDKEKGSTISIGDTNKKQWNDQYVEENGVYRRKEHSLQPAKVMKKENDLELPAIKKETTGLTQWKRQDTSRGFVPAGQSTQMIIGATGESDYEIMAVSQALYQKFDLKRVFYSAFINVNQDATLPALQEGPPLLREHRLYQADWLLRYYGFDAEELLSPSRPNFNEYLDPKCDWALGHMSDFPVEINKADYDTLLRVPGIGMKSAQRICGARKSGTLDFTHLKKMGVVLKRAIYFITCNGKMMYDFLMVEEDFITRQLVGEEKEIMKNFGKENVTYKQLSLFDIDKVG